MRALMLLLCALLASSGGTVTPQVYEVPLGEPDKTGSWGSINQEIKRCEDWNHYVQQSDFPLGDRYVKGHWTLYDGSKESYYEQQYGGYPRLDGSTVCVPMAIEFARQHLGLSDNDASRFVQFTTTHSAYRNLIERHDGFSGVLQATPHTVLMQEEHPVDMILATEPSDEELMMAKNAGVELVCEPVCYDAFVFIVNKSNPIDSLTVDQIRDIYAGKITNWAQLGGSDLPITAYQRDINSGSQTTMEKQVMRGQPMMPAPMVATDWGMGELVDAVSEYRNAQGAIGYTFRFYIEILYKSEDIKVLRVDGIEPSEANIRTEKYPFTTHYFGVIRAGDEQNVGGRFLDWTLSAEGQSCIRQSGYVSLG